MFLFNFKIDYNAFGGRAPPGPGKGDRSLNPECKILHPKLAKSKSKWFRPISTVKTKIQYNTVNTQNRLNSSGANWPGGRRESCSDLNLANEK